jgi:hypothetical protein
VSKTLLWAHSENGGDRSQESWHEAGTSNFEVQARNQRSYKDRKILFIDESNQRSSKIERFYSLMSQHGTKRRSRCCILFLCL